jgi:ribosomal protein L16 Arg81 hydroxylase
MAITVVGLFPPTSRALISAVLGMFKGDEDNVRVNGTDHSKRRDRVVAQGMNNLHVQSLARQSLCQRIKT